jgi:hypothetical protein
MLERSHLAGTFPKLNVAGIDETLRFSMASASSAQINGTAS